ncbi:uncharacterized protein PSANT_02395 [Moesziomyces antarcticus]|uniref:Uncharacterized protein n=1 Tax=Pseudozyma antarctica TaxID=84753 RepID=A0A5C3FMQ1_PSEA2|nr:uncharacterized protein PSANT_02395 [Moesziomyces antarcticus]
MTREQRAQWVGAARLRSCAVARHTTSSEACVSSGRGLWLSICHLIRRCVVLRKYGFLSGKFERRRWDCTRAVATHAGRSCGAVARRKRDAASHDALEHGSTACNQGRPRDEIGLMACPHRHQTAPSAACIPVTDTGRRLLLLRGRVGGNAPRAAGYSSDARSSAAPAVAMQEVPIPPRRAQSGTCAARPSLRRYDHPRCCSARSWLFDRSVLVTGSLVVDSRAQYAAEAGCCGPMSRELKLDSAIGLVKRPTPAACF